MREGAYTLVWTYVLVSLRVMSRAEMTRTKRRRLVQLIKRSRPTSVWPQVNRRAQRVRWNEWLTILATQRDEPALELSNNFAAVFNHG